MTPQDEAFLASWLARGDWPRARPLLAELLKAPIEPADDLVARIRRDLWRDFSEPARER